MTRVPKTSNAPRSPSRVAFLPASSAGAFLSKLHSLLGSLIRLSPGVPSARHSTEVLLCIALLFLSPGECSGNPRVKKHIELSNQLYNLLSPLIIRDSWISEKVADVGAELVASWEQKEPSDYSFQFYILSDPSPNSFSTPVGEIYVTTGLLDRLDSEDELAVVLAREIALVEGDAPWNSYRRERMTDTAVFLSTFVIFAALEVVYIKNALDNVEAGVYTADTYNSLYFIAIPYIPQKILTHLRAQRIADSGMRAPLRFGRRLVPTTFDAYLLKTVHEGFGERVELDADVEAMRLTARAGWDPLALLSVLEKLAGFHSSGKEHLRSTAPGLEKRIMQLDKLVSSGNLMDFLEQTDEISDD